MDSSASSIPGSGKQSKEYDMSCLSVKEFKIKHSRGRGEGVWKLTFDSYRLKN